LLIVDLFNERMASGLEYCREFKRCCPGSKILAFSEAAEYRDLSLASAWGVDSFVYSAETPEQLSRSVEATLSGARVWVMSAAAPENYQSGFGLAAKLTPRERQIVELVSMRHTNRQIGNLLSISPNTVKNHVASILRKLNLPSRSDLFGTPLFAPTAQNSPKLAG
ncbi:DNA-binding response regulator, partial [Nocardia sp. NPDC058497]|uniref:response regulator transcription factor n=1 Tax=Nocardia sp. NPDC058497 TaxID=3346529 RepID=UPI00364BCC40